MIDLSNYSCDKCSRNFSRHCKHCFHTADKVPTKFKPKKKAGCETPEFRKPTAPPIPPRYTPPPMPPVKPAKPKENVSNIQGELTMKEQDIIKIRNKAGILDVKLIKQLDLRDVTRGFCEELEFNGRCRLEFHQKNSDEMIVTLCERNPNNTKMIIAHIDFGDVTVFLGEMIGTEQDEMLFETIEKEN